MQLKTCLKASPSFPYRALGLECNTGSKTITSMCNCITASNAVETMDHPGWAGSGTPLECCNFRLNLYAGKLLCCGPQGLEH